MGDYGKKIVQRSQFSLTYNQESSLLVCFFNIKEVKIMSDLNRGIMKFDGADKPPIVAISSVIVLGSIIALIIWALRTAYAVH